MKKQQKNTIYLYLNRKKLIREDALNDDSVGDYEYLSVEVDSYKVTDIDTLDDLRSAEFLFDGIGVEDTSE